VNRPRNIDTRKGTETLILVSCFIVAFPLLKAGKRGKANARTDPPVFIDKASAYGIII